MAKSLGVLVALGSVVLGGCNSTFFKPFDADQGSVSMDARQRTILSVERGEPPETHRVVCAEPSPDAMATIAASAASSAGVSGPQLPFAAELAASLTSAEQAAMIGARNSTIQLLRDGLYRACEAYMNGALGDFGYGLVLVNYGRVMVSLLTADGLVRPAMAPPVVIGSLIGELKTSVDGSASVPATPAGGAQDGAAGGSATNKATADAGANTGLPSATAPAAAAAGIDGEHAARIFENVVFPLANPTSDPAGKFIEVTVACMLWLDNTGLRHPKTNGNSAMQDLCHALIQRTPQLAEQAIVAKMTEQALLAQAKASAAAGQAGPEIRSASLER